MDERITYTAESLVMLAAVLLADAQAGRGNAEMKRRSAECARKPASLADYFSLRQWTA